MQELIIFLLVTIFLSWSFNGLAGSKETVVTFAEAWNMVDGENDALKAARAKVEQAEFTQDGTNDLNLPEVSISASYVYLDDAIELSPNDIFESMAAGQQASSIVSGLAGNFGMTPAQLNAGLTSTIADRENLTSSIRATWPIYTGGRISAAQDIASGQLSEANSDLRLKTLEQFENLVRYYFGAVLARQVFETRKEVEKGLKKHRDHAVLLEGQGQIARVERMQSEASFDKAMVERRKAHRDLEIAQVALTRLLKSPETIVPADPLFVAEGLPLLDVFIENTLIKYPGLSILDSKKEQVAGLAAVEEGKYYPTVALFGNYSLYEENDLATKLIPDWVVGIGIKIPLLERSGRSGKFHAAKSAMKRIEHLQFQARSDLSVLVEKTYRQAEQALEEYEGLESSQKLAEETVNLRGKAFNQGLSTSLDVVDAELFLAGVKTQRAVAVYNYVVALGKLLTVSADPQAFFNYQNNKGIEGH